MANTVINLVDLDFNRYKESLKTYAREQSLFKDYDFDGSNFSVLNDILAYNTYHNAFYLNMLFSEMFLDSAQLRNSISSHSKDLNYLPRSFRSAKIIVDISIDTTDATTPVSMVTIPKNHPFSTRVNSKTYQFVPKENILVTESENSVFTAHDVELYEGNYILDTFYTNYSIERQRFILSDPTIDTSSITVVVADDDSAVTYNLAISLLGLTQDSEVFFLQPVENDKYEVVFGNGIIGKKPKNGSTIYVEYRVCNGELPNGAFEFIADRAIGEFGNIEVAVGRDSAGAFMKATGGAIHESIDEVRFNAPRHYQTQERAITVNDYEILLKQQYPEINAITVFGGEDATPPQYGRVFIVVDLFGFDGIPDYKKQEFALWLRDKMPVTVEPMFIDPSFTFAGMDVTVKYNMNKTDLSYADISTRVMNTIIGYSAANMNRFRAKLRFSKLLSTIDETHPSIVSSYSTFMPYKKIVPEVSVAKNYDLPFNMPLKNTHSPVGRVYATTKEVVLTSSTFTFSGKKCRLEDDNQGNVRIVYDSMDNNVTVVQNVGTINYDTGRVVLNSFVVSAFVDGAIKIYVTPRSNDVNFSRNEYFEIKEEDIKITVVGLRE